MANVTDLQTKYSKLAQEYSKVKTFTLQNKVLINTRRKSSSQTQDSV